MNEQQFARHIVEKLKQSGHQALWAGGCVRDLLLGISPSDFDVATSAVPQQVRQLFGHKHTLAVGASFGVIIVLSHDRKHQVEVATFRTDAAYSDGRHPDSITFSTPELDAQRRDFTINGLFFDPIAAQVIDFVGGQDDLSHRILRAIGNPEARIAEDKLRMLRAVRFAARFDLQIEPLTWAAIVGHSSEAAWVSGERLAMEVRKTLETPKPAWALEKWAQTGLLKVLMPEIDAAWDNCSTQTLRLVATARNQSWHARLAAIFWSAQHHHSTAEPTKLFDLSFLKRRLKLANDDFKAIEFALHSQATLQDASLAPWSKVQPLMISPWIRCALELLEMRVTAGEPYEASLQWLNSRLAWTAEQLDPPPLITGQDLMNLGLTPSPYFKQLLHQARCHQLDGFLRDKNQALVWIQTQGPEDASSLKR